MLSKKQQFIKRLFDILLAVILIPIVSTPLIVLFVGASIDTQSFGLFTHKRVGKEAKLFTLFKLKTMRLLGNGTLVTSNFGKLLRRTKLDELPQIFNIILGEMSFVGPRPDIMGYADKLQGEEKLILSVRPGLTGPATIKFSNEEALLSRQENPLEYNDTVIWPQKVEINLDYVRHWNFMKDLRYLWFTIKQLLH
ncbi:MAG: sugar transferase [Bacteroidetes bacterium MedPE-SWsnd-G1]|mgnify:CR=1 FL=1|nr:MAG: sugar transferase [Bacteroidetes bacterium MedPE-SWsnd-G1]